MKNGLIGREKGRLEDSWRPVKHSADYHSQCQFIIVNVLPLTYRE